MIKLKSLILGAVSSLLMFLLFIILLSFIAAKLGVMELAVFRNLSMVFAVVAIVVGSGLAAKHAKEKGAIYGLILAVIWLLITFVIAAICGLAGNEAAIAIRIIMYLAGGMIGGLLGVSLKRRSKYI